MPWLQNYASLITQTTSVFATVYFTSFPVDSKFTSVDSHACGYCHATVSQQDSATVQWKMLRVGHCHSGLSFWWKCTHHSQIVFEHVCVFFFPHMGGASVVFPPSVDNLINQQIQNRLWAMHLGEQLRAPVTAELGADSTSKHDLDSLSYLSLCCSLFSFLTSTLSLSLSLFLLHSLSLSHTHTDRHWNNVPLKRSSVYLKLLLIHPLPAHPTPSRLVHDPLCNRSSAIVHCNRWETQFHVRHFSHPFRKVTKNGF